MKEGCRVVDVVDTILIRAPNTSAAYTQRLGLNKTYDHIKLLDMSRYMKQEKFHQYLQAQQHHTKVGKRYISTTRYATMVAMDSYIHELKSYHTLRKEGAKDISSLMRSQTQLNGGRGLRNLMPYDAMREHRILLILYTVHMINHILVCDYFKNKPTTINNNNNNNNNNDMAGQRERIMMRINMKDNQKQ